MDTPIEEKEGGLYWIRNDSIEVAVFNYKGRIISLWFPDGGGEMTDVVVGMGTIKAS